jgi:hypothetical protein
MISHNPLVLGIRDDVVMLKGQIPDGRYVY